MLYAEFEVVRHLFGWALLVRKEEDFPTITLGEETIPPLLSFYVPPDYTPPSKGLVNATQEAGELSVEFKGLVKRTEVMAFVVSVKTDKGAVAHRVELDGGKHEQWAGAFDSPPPPGTSVKACDCNQLCRALDRGVCR